MKTNLLLASLICSPVIWAGNITSYAKDPDLAPVVTEYLSRNRSESFRSLHALLKAKPCKLDAHRLGMIVAASYDDFDAFYTHSNNILVSIADDEQALSLRLLYGRALGNEKLYERTLLSLQNSSPYTAEKILTVIQDVEMRWNQSVVGGIPKVENAKLGILALGSPANPDGSPRPRLQNTLFRTLEAAKAYPQAPIIVTGGAVYTNIAEALAMKNWLVAKGIEPGRIIMEDKALDTMGNAINISPYIERQKLNQLFLITVQYHLQRSLLTFEGVFKTNNTRVLLTGIAADSDLKGEPFRDRMKIERIASYRDRSRAIGLYEHDDFLAKQ